MSRRPLTHAEALAAWRVDSELRGGHSPEQTIGFVSALMDLEDERRVLPEGFVPADYEPKWRTALNRWFGR
jgi:hypothetical protein